MKTYVKIDRKVLFEICDTILSYEGGYNVNECADNLNGAYFTWPWDKKFRKKVENIRYNS